MYSYMRYYLPPDIMRCDEHQASRTTVLGHKHISVIHVLAVDYPEHPSSPGQIVRRLARCVQPIPFQTSRRVNGRSPEHMAVTGEGEV